VLHVTANDYPATEAVVSVLLVDGDGEGVGHTVTANPEFSPLPQG
jgi:hypothetical protein